MSDQVRITVLVENATHRLKLAAEHGLSFHIQAGPHSLVFDAGQTDMLLLNAEALGIDLSDVDAIVLSHGHHDHTGGLPELLEVACNARVYAHPSALGMKYSKPPGAEPRYNGMSPAARQAVRQLGQRFIETRTRTEVVSGAFVTGEIPRQTRYEDTGGPFFLDAAGTQPDPLIDDQALVIDLGDSLIVLLGCTHSGAVNTLEHVSRLSGGKPVRAVIGGLHLGNAGPERMNRTIARLRDANLRCLAPMHCTGWPATALLWQAMPEIFQPGGVGSAFQFPYEKRPPTGRQEDAGKYPGRD
jgi:7,8-dihydropterin-6-yl-methyl-4-(beta-D-ribofuranosyl)aminobenzene 5'-phosphate synthase